jgi:hypothetical protein
VFIDLLCIITGLGLEHGLKIELCVWSTSYVRRLFLTATAGEGRPYLLHWPTLPLWKREGLERALCRFSSRYELPLENETSNIKKRTLMLSSNFSSKNCFNREKWQTLRQHTCVGSSDLYVGVKNSTFISQRKALLVYCSSVSSNTGTDLHLWSDTWPSRLQSQDWMKVYPLLQTRNSKVLFDTLLSHMLEKSVSIIK